MATVVQQSQPLQSAGDFWRAQMEKRPNLHGWFTSIWAVVSFFLNGHVIVHAARWVIRWCGYVAESALLFAVLWISGTSVAPGFIELFMSKGTMQWLVWLSLLALALIPEVILGNAIINTVSHWQRVANNRRKIMSWVWAILFTLPTAMFFLLTAITINTLTSNGGNVVQAGNTMLGLRCFTGWTYGLLTIVYAGVGKQMVQAPSTLANVTSITPVHDPRVDQLLESMNTLSEQVKSVQSNVTERQQQEPSIEQNEQQKNNTSERSERTQNRTPNRTPRSARRHASRRSEQRTNRATKSAKSKQPSAYDLVFEVLKEKRSATVAEIVLRTKLAKSTVSPLRTQILKQIEQQQMTSTERDTGEIVAIS